MSKSFSKRLRLMVIALFSCVLIACLVFGLSACGSSDKNKAEMTLGLNHTSYTMAPGDKDTLEVYVTQSDGKEYSGDYVWYSSDENIVSVTDNRDVCIVEAKSVGTARVTCEVGNYTVFCSYNVVEVTDISIAPESLEVEVGSEESLKVTVTMSDNSTSSDFTYGLSGGDGVVEISRSGSTLTVKGLKTGSATLTVTAGGKTESCIITVVEAKSEAHVHEYEATGEWGNDYSSCVITLKCKNSDGLCDNAEVVIPTEDVTVSSTEVKADCATVGSIIYTATATYESKEYTVTEEVEIPATGHTAPDETDDANAVWSWDTSDTTPTANVKITCSVCGETLYEGEAEVSPIDEGYVAPGCESAGTQYYEGTVSFALMDGTQCKYTDKICVTLNPTGHTYPDSVTQGDLYHWTFPEGNISEGTEVTITAECVVCHQTIENLTATITDINTVPATAENSGSITYTAVVEIEGKNVTLTFVEILTAEGHTYPDDGDTTYVVWDWENMDTESQTVSYTVYCADGDDFTLYEGTATYSYTTTNPTCDVAGGIYYTATATVTADGTTHTYLGTYSEEIPATGHAWTAQFDWNGVGDIAETETGTVQVTLTCSECGTSETLEASYTRTEYVASTCDDAGHMTFTATLNVEGVDEPFTSSTNVTLPLSGEHTYPEDGSTNVVWDWENRNEVDNTVKLTVYCTVCGRAVIENYEVEYAADQSGTYWVATYTDGTHEYTSSYLISQDEEADVVVEVDFNGGSFSSTQTAFVTESEKDTEGNQTAPGNSAVVEADGGSTGFTAIGTASDSKTIQIGASAGYTYLAFNGSTSTTKNSVSFYLEAGIYMVEISYFSGSSERWATVLDSSGKDKDELIAEEDKTSGSGEIKTRTIYFSLDTAQNIYIGSKNSGLYVTFIGIYKVEAEETKTVIGVSLDESSTQLEMGSSMVISAMAELSDGKHYLGYTDAEYSWDVSGNGSATYTGSGDNITVTGESLGQVVVTVTVNGTYSAYCEIEIIEKVVYDITSLTIDFSDSDTYSWINTSNTGNDYSYWIVTLVHGWNSIGSGRLNTGGGSSTGNGRYFILDLSEYMGQTLTITVDFESAGTSSGDRSVCLDTQCSSAGSTTSSTTLAYATSNISGDRQKLEYSGIIENDVLYLTYSGNINIYSIEISIESGDPTVMGVTLSSESVVVNVGDTFTITADVEMNFGTYEGSYVWEVVGNSGIVETDYSAGGTANVLTVTAVGEGTVTITLTVDDFTASCKVTVYPEGESIYETVTTVFDYATALAYYGSGNGPTSGSQYVQGIFTVSGGARFYDEYINTQGNDIIVTMSGIDNTISFTGTGASSTANPLTVSLYKDGEDITPNDWSSVNLANSAVSGFYVSGLGAGTYTIKTSASVRIENLTVTQSLPVSDPDGIIVTVGNVDFLKGRNIDVNDLGLNIILHYENGREDPLTVSEVAVAIDSDLSEGAHEVTVTYHYDDDKGNQADFSATVYIFIYSVESITISDFSMEYTGGTYYTNNVQKIFLVGDGINYDYAAVTATAVCTYYDAESGTSKTMTKEFVLKSDEVYFSTNANMNVVGTYAVTATVDMGVSEGDAKTATYQINVVTKEGADITTVEVNQTASIGMDENGVYTVNTVNDAIMLIKLLGASDAERKFIYVTAGTYDEKIYINIPNLSLIGSNPSDDDSLATRSGVTEIVFDAMNGVMDPSGTTTYSTVGSATVTVASQATGFYAANITFRNYWNTNDLYNQAKDITSSTQADAAYINADQSYFYNVTFTGYHDTLEAENGRQVYDHCYIEGRTDYIFGSTATCYFNNCTIHSIGAGTNESNGGYVVAYKGNGDAGTVDYGYIFDGCTFEGDDNVKEHSVALGRAWGEDMMMVIMNSTFDSSFAMGGYTGASSALRYCQMNYDPDFTKIFEYNNTGDSAIDSTTAGYTVDGTSGLVKDSGGNSVFTIPSEQQIADFSDLSVIFAATNGTVSYGSAWDGKCDVVTITVMDNSGVLTTVYGTGALSVSDLKIAINVRLGDTEVDNIYMDSSFSTELTGNITSDTTVYVSIGEKDMTVPASVTYDFYGEDSDSDEDISGWYGYLYVDLGGNGSFKSNKSGWYMLTGDATITVKLSAGSTISVQMFESDKMLINGSAVTGVDNGTGTYWYTYEVEETREIIISANGTLYIRTIEIVVPVIYEIGDTIYLNDLDSGDGSYNVSAGGTGSYKGMGIEGYFRNNGNSFQVDVGTVIKIQSVPGATAKLSFYQDAYWVEANIVTDTEGLITITITSKSEYGGYISSIRIVDGGESSVIYQIGDEISFVGMNDGDIYSDVGVYEYKGIVITGTFRNNSNSVQVEEGTTIQIQSTPDAAAEVIFYQGFTGDYEVSTDENGLITIVITGDTGSSGIYLTGINIITNPDYEGSDEEPADVYAGSITFNPDSLTVEEGESGSFSFEISITKNGEEYFGTDIDITVQSNDTGVAYDSWDQSTNTVTVTGVSEGTTYISIIVKVGDTNVLDVQYVITVTATTPSEPGDQDELPSISVDFGNSETYSWITTETVTYKPGESGEKEYSNAVAGSSTSDNGLLTIVGTSDNSSNTPMDINFSVTGGLSTGGKTQSNGRYFVINLDDYKGKYISIEATFCTGSNNSSRTLILSTDISTSASGTGVIYSESSSSSSENAKFTYSDVIENDKLYLTWDNNIRIYSIEIKIYEDSGSGDGSDVPSVGEHTYPDANDSVHVIWGWEGKTETSETTGYVTVAIICVDCGEIIVSEQTSYIVDPNNDAYWYAEVSENDTTYSSMYRIPGEGTAYVAESFLVPVAGDDGNVTNKSYSENEVMNDNSLFSLTANIAMMYSVGSSYGTIQNNGTPHYTDISGNTVYPDQGIKLSSYLSTATSEEAPVESGTVLTVTAKENITLYLYVNYTADGYSGNRAGKILYSIDGGTKITAVEGTNSDKIARGTITTIVVSLEAEQSLTLEVQNLDTSYTGNFWFFGAEACNEGDKIEYGNVFTVYFNTNQDTISGITTDVFNYSVVTAPVLPNVTDYYFAGWYMNEKCTAVYDFSEPVTSDIKLYAKWVELDTKITYIEGAYESIAVEFSDTDASKATIYYKMVSDASYTKMTDVDAIRQLDDGTVRVDIMGLQGDEYYNVKILTSGNVEIACYSIYVVGYDRSGYAHFNYDDGVGAYDDAGMLKDGALVIYVTDDNKNDVTDDVYKYDKASDSYSRVEWTELSQYLQLTDSNDKSNYDRNGDGYIKGIGEILNNSRYSTAGRSSVGIAALCDAYGAVDVRIVGEIKATVSITSSYEGEDKETGGTMTLYTGYYDIIGLTDLNATTNGGSEGDNGGLVRIRNAHDVTIEGVGEGATLNGWGISIVADSNATNRIAEGFEVRNLTFKNTPEDAVGIEGNQSGNELTATVERCWIHNNSFYIGHCDYPAESDKGDGDGTIDFKRGQYLTISYNYFEGCHKTILLGSNSSSLQYNISMHHNYWYECQQRMPLVRNANVHFYNNYINGNSDSNLLYVTSVRANSYVYSEYNYYENCRSVCLVVEENGAGGVMKSYMNEYHNCYGSDYTAEDEDVDESVHVSSRTEYVENNCKDEANGIDYSRFDTDPTLFYYDATKGRSDCYLTSAAQAKNDVIRMAGAFSRNK